MSSNVTARDFNPSNNDLVDAIKEKANEFAELLDALPDSRRKAIALTNIESASMFAVKAVFYDDNNERTGA